MCKTILWVLLLCCPQWVSVFQSSHWPFFSKSRTWTQPGSFQGNMVHQIREYGLMHEKVVPNDICGGLGHCQGERHIILQVVFWWHHSNSSLMNASNTHAGPSLWHHVHTDFWVMTLLRSHSTAFSEVSKCSMLSALLETDHGVISSWFKKPTASLFTMKRNNSFQSMMLDIDSLYTEMLLMSGGN